MEDIDMKLTEMSAEELASFKAEVQKKYDDFKAQGLSLNMARGKPSSAKQSSLLFTAVSRPSVRSSCSADGFPLAMFSESP